MSAACSVTGIMVSFLLMLAVTCTMAEGMRITCTSMGLNSANNKGESCYEKLDKRVRECYVLREVKGEREGLSYKVMIIVFWL